MNKFLQKFSSVELKNKLADSNTKIVGAINAHPEIFCISLLAISCLVFLFFGLGFYPLIDVDETRYAVMSRDLLNSFDWNSLMLNGVPFLEKPPLYFWFVGASIKFFGEFSSFAVRFPIALLTAFLIFATYYFGKKVLSRKFGVIAALTLLSSAFFLILAHIAILDMVLTVFMTCALYCGFLTHFCDKKNKKYFWLLFYVFMGLGFLAKGILALAIPMTIMFIYNLVTKTLKDMFHPVNLILGGIIFVAITLPWHFIMYQKYGFYFIREYFLIHHFGRFMGSEYIGRERPIYYFIPIFLLGFMPWTFIFLAYITDGIKKIVAKYKNAQGMLKDKLAVLFESKTNDQKVLLFSSISFIVIFLVFSTSSTKLPTYILPVFPFAALLMGYFWWVSDKNGENEKSIYDMTMLLATIFIFLAIGASMSYYFLPHNLQSKLTMLIDTSIVGLYLIGMFLILRSNTKRALSTFLGYFVSMLFIITLAVTQIFTFVYNGGENELVQYSSNISIIKNSQLITFDFAVKPSVLINFHEKVTFLTDPDFKELDRLLVPNNGPIFVIVKNKNFKDNPEYLQNIEKRLELIKQGERYSLYIKPINEKFDNQVKMLVQ